MVEMEYFRMIKSVNEINGWFTLLNYDLVEVSFTVQGDEIFFGFNETLAEPSKRERMKNLFDHWFKKEKEEYITFIQNFLNEIRILETYSEFKGEIIQEEKTTSSNFGAHYTIDVKYENILHNIRFIFLEKNSYTEISCHIQLPINSENKLAHPILLGKTMQEETKKRMWDPFRDKTAFRLKLLHTLR